MREPDFWWQAKGGRLLAPFGAIYGAVAAYRLKSPGQKVGSPVICLGNLTMGGAGKTPAALAVGQLLLGEHKRPFFLARGYGGGVAGRGGAAPSAMAASSRRVHCAHRYQSRSHTPRRCLLSARPRKAWRPCWSMLGATTSQSSTVGLSPTARTSI